MLRYNGVYKGLVGTYHEIVSLPKYILCGNGSSSFRILARDIYAVHDLLKLERYNDYDERSILTGLIYIVSSSASALRRFSCNDEVEPPVYILLR